MPDLPFTPLGLQNFGRARVVVPSDAVFLRFSAIYVGTPGDVVCVPFGQTEPVTFKDVPVGILPVSVTKILATGTTATDMLGFGSPYGSNPYEILTSDEFTGPNATGSLNGRVLTPGGTRAGLTWSNPNTIWGISNNMAYRSGTGGAGPSYVNVDIGTPNVTVEVDITLSAVRATAGVLLRAGGGSYLHIEAVHPTGGPGRLSIMRRTPTEDSSIVNAPYPFVLGGTYKFQAVLQGAAGSLYIDNVFVASFNGIAISGTAFGLYSFWHANHDDGGSRWNNFKISA